MSDIDQAIQVGTYVDIDWAELGRVFADQPSPHQAAFIMGFYKAVMDVQLAYIGSEPAFDAHGERSQIAALMGVLAEFIGAPDGGGA